MSSGLPGAVPRISTQSFPAGPSIERPAGSAASATIGAAIQIAKRTLERVLAMKPLLSTQRTQTSRDARDFGGQAGGGVGEDFLKRLEVLQDEQGTKFTPVP